MLIRVPRKLRYDNLCKGKEITHAECLKSCLRLVAAVSGDSILDSGCEIWLSSFTRQREKRLNANNPRARKQT